MGCTVVKYLLVLLCGLASVAGSAFAADLPKREIGPAPALAPVFTWAGFYIGTQTAAINLDGNVRTSGNAGSTIAEVASLRRPGSLSLDDTNLASGAQVGFNVQYGAIVLGLEGDLAFADVSPRSLFFSPASDPSAFRQDLEWFGTARGRVGFAFDQALIYATGGLAFGDVTNKVAFLRNTDFAFQHMGRSSDWGVGYAIGGGVEFLLPAFLGDFSIVGRLLGASSVTVKAEYLYFDLGDKNVLVNAVPGAGINSFTSNFETKGHTGRIGFNYRFGT
jgi:outer membrane immunogenic protein